MFSLSTTPNIDVEFNFCGNNWPDATKKAQGSVKSVFYELWVKDFVKLVKGKSDH